MVVATIFKEQLNEDMQPMKKFFPHYLLYEWGKPPDCILCMW